MTGKFLEYILIGYLSGSILYAYLLPRYLKHVDVTEKSGDGNPGAANAFLYAGIPMGILVPWRNFLQRIPCLDW